MAVSSYFPHVMDLPGSSVARGVSSPVSGPQEKSNSVRLKG